MPKKLPQYLRIERRRAGLSQKDVAALLGVIAASKISRYERGRRLPPLKTALAYEAILGKPIAELFGGTFEGIRREVEARARGLAGHEGRRKNGIVEARRKESITSISSR